MNEEELTRAVLPAASEMLAEAFGAVDLDSRIAVLQGLADRVAPEVRERTLVMAFAMSVGTIRGQLSDEHVAEIQQSSAFLRMTVPLKLEDES